MSQATPFAGTTFGAQAERSSWFADAVVREVDATRPLRVLDIGCGTGAHVFALAARMLRATFVGVDISAANIERAEEARRASPAADRIVFRCTDYLQSQAGPFDLIVSDSTLHLISARTRDLVAKIAGDLAPQGLLIATIPDGRVYNRALWLLRRLFVWLRALRLDGWVPRAAMALYRGRHDAEFVRERIMYLYILPYRHEGEHLREEARAHGLDWIAAHPVPTVSRVKAVHVLTMYRKAGPGK